MLASLATLMRPWRTVSSGMVVLTNDLKTEGSNRTKKIHDSNLPGSTLLAYDSSRYEHLVPHASVECDSANSSGGSQNSMEISIDIF